MSTCSGEPLHQGRATHTTHHTRIPHQIHRQGWQSLLRALWWGCKAVSSPCRPTRLSPIGLMNWLKRQQQALHASLHQAKPVGSSSSLDHLRNAHLSDSTCMHHHPPRTDPDWRAQHTNAESNSCVPHPSRVPLHIDFMRHPRSYHATNPCLMERPLATGDSSAHCYSLTQVTAPCGCANKRSFS